MKERKKEKKKTEREENQEIGPVVHAERERSEGTEDKGHGVNVGDRQSAQSSSGKGQRATAAIEGGWVEKNLRCGFNFQSKRL